MNEAQQPSNKQENWGNKQENWGNDAYFDQINAEFSAKIERERAYYALFMKRTGIAFGIFFAFTFFLLESSFSFGSDFFMELFTTAVMWLTGGILVVSLYYWLRWQAQPMPLAWSERECRVAALKLAKNYGYMALIVFVLIGVIPNIIAFFQPDGKFHLDGHDGFILIYALLGLLGLIVVMAGGVFYEKSKKYTHPKP